MKPNVILIMADQLKAGALRAYGNGFLKTPALDKLADEGVLFTNAFTPHPLCVPARISTWCSQYPHTHGGRRNESSMPQDAVHAFKLWKQEGLTAGLIGKNHCFKTQADLDLFDVWCEIEHRGLVKAHPCKGLDWPVSVEDIEKAHETRKNMEWKTPRIAYSHSEHPLEHYSTGLITDQTLKFLEEYRNEPFALWVSYPDPHGPYDVPKKYFDAIINQVELPPWDDDEFTNAPERNKIFYEMMGLKKDNPVYVKEAIATYYAMIKFIDVGIGRILDKLAELNLMENSIIVFCADHGECAGEHGLLGKAGVFYDCHTRIPLIVSAPGMIPRGQVEESMVSLIDIVPTLLKLQNMEIPGCMEGKPLPGITDAEPREAVFSEYGAGGRPFTSKDLHQLAKPYGHHTILQTLRWREAEGRCKMIRTKEWKYVHDPMGDIDELYDMVHDPWEQRNLMDDPQYEGIINQMRLKLLDWCIRHEDGKPVPLPEEEFYNIII